MNFENGPAPLLLSLAHVVLGIAVLIVSKFAKTALGPYRTDQELTATDNPAFGLPIAGYYLAVVAVYVGASHGQPPPLDAGTGGALLALGLNLAWALAGVL